VAFFGKRPPKYPEPVYQQTRLPPRPAPPPAQARPVRPPTAFLMHLARGIAYGIGVTIGFLLVIGALALLAAGLADAVYRSLVGS
jgi:hypothetical protein